MSQAGFHPVTKIVRVCGGGGGGGGGGGLYTWVPYQLFRVDEIQLPGTSFLYQALYNNIIITTQNCYCLA